MQPNPHVVVRLHGQPGHLRTLIDTAPATPPSFGAGSRDLPTGSEAPPIGGASAMEASTLVWEGAMDGLALASLLASSMRHAMVPCEIEGRPYRARAQGCWFDAGRGVLVVELVGRPEPMA